MEVVRHKDKMLVLSSKDFTYRIAYGKGGLEMVATKNGTGEIIAFNRFDEINEMFVSDSSTVNTTLV